MPLKLPISGWENLDFLKNTPGEKAWRCKNTIDYLKDHYWKILCTLLVLKT